MASSSFSAPSCTWKYDVFPSFRGEDVRDAFLSHLLEKLRSKAINTFIDDGIERSHLIAPALKSAIRESRISMVIFSENYASSTWCLNELVEIHNCSKELNQIVFPIFYKVDPSHVRKQTGDFGKVLKKTCEGVTDGYLKKKWMEALAEVASTAGEPSEKWKSEAEMVEKISEDVSNKLFTTVDDFRDFVGIDAHVEAMNSMLCFESGGVRMVGIVGTSGIGKSTIARALFSRRKSQFEHQTFVSYKRSIEDKNKVDFRVQLSWVNQFLSEILGIKDIKNDSLGAVKERLKHKKVLVVLDDVDEIELLETLVGEAGWFGYGSRIIVVTQNKALLKSHDIELVYEVQFPSQEVALEMFCRSAFRKKSRDDFMRLAVEVAELAGNHPLSLNVLGSFLRGKDKKEWEEMMPRIRGGLDDKIGKILKVCYDRLDSKDDQELFLYIACLFNGESFSSISDLLEGVYTSVNTRIRMLADKSLIRITTPEDTVQMHTLLHKLGRDIVREESKNDPGKRRFLVGVEDIREVLTYKTGTENVLGICLNKSDIDENKPFFVDENSFEGMHNLQFIKFYGDTWDLFDRHEVKLKSPRGLIYLPPKLRLLHWDYNPGKYIPSNFNAEYLVELIMVRSKLQRLWEGTLPLQHLKKMDLSLSEDLKEIPNLSKAKNLKVLNLLGCSEPMDLPESLERLYLTQGSSLESFPGDRSLKASLWIENMHRITHLSWQSCPLRCMPSNFRTEHLLELHMPFGKFEKLWEGVRPLENLVIMNLSGSKNLKEIPDLSKATKLKKLDMCHCTSLEVLPTNVNLESLEELNLFECSRLRSFPQVSTSIKKLNLYKTAIEEVPSWIENMSELEKLHMCFCKKLEVLPTGVNLESLEKLDLNFCSRLRSFPQISTSIKKLRLEGTAIEEVPCWIENMSNLEELDMSECKSLKNISASIFKLRHLKEAYFAKCKELTSFSDASVVTKVACITDSLDFPQISTSNKELDLNRTAIEEVPSWIKNMSKLKRLDMGFCKSLEVLLTDVNLESLEYLNLGWCSRLRSFPQISKSIKYLYLNDTAIEEVPCWIENMSNLKVLDMSRCERLKNIPPSIFKLRHLKEALFSGCTELMSFSDECVVVTEARISDSLNFPHISTSIKKRGLNGTTIEEVPPWIENMSKLKKLDMRECTSLEVLPTGVNLESLEELYLYECSRLRSFPQISTNIKRLNLEGTAIEEVPSWIENISNLEVLDMSECKRLKNISASIFKLRHLKEAKFTRCSELTSFSDASLVATAARFTDLSSDNLKYFDFDYCWSLDGNAHEFLLGLSIPMKRVLPGRQVPTYFSHLARSGNSLVISLPSSPSHLSSEYWRSSQSGEECDAESGRCKKQMRMTVGTTEEPSNSLCDQIMADTELPPLNLELSLGSGVGSVQVSSRRKIPSSSVSCSNDFHGDGALSLSLSYPCLEEEALGVDPMITEL